MKYIRKTMHHPTLKTSISLKLNGLKNLNSLRLKILQNFNGLENRNFLSVGFEWCLFFGCSRCHHMLKHVVFRRHRDIIIIMKNGKNTDIFEEQMKAILLRECDLHLIYL